MYTIYQVIYTASMAFHTVLKTIVPIKSTAKEHL